MSLETPSIAMNSHLRNKIPILPQKRQNQQKSKETSEDPPSKEIDLTELRKNVKDVDTKILKKVLLTTNEGPGKKRSSSGLGYLDTTKQSTMIASDLQSIRSRLEKTKENVDQL